MKISFILALIFTLALASPGCIDKSTDVDTIDTTGGGTSGGTKTEWPCGTHNGKTLYTGPKGGCYYYNSSGSKVYVDHSECNC